MSRINKLLDKAKNSRLSAAEKKELKELHYSKMITLSAVPQYRYQWDITNKKNG